MTTRNGQPPMIPGCDVLPPLEPDEPTYTTDERPTPKGKTTGPTAQRFKTLNTFVDLIMRELTGAETAVWMVLYRDTRDGLAQTSQEDIARRAGITDRTVRRVIGRLERRGLLTTVYRGGLNRGTSKYRISPKLTGQPLRT